ncbi:MAG: LysR family transcriptional regulator [Myxococcaceae bacterium]|nr:LysR family transcriptional regulator [Myxococcaceae bacterium]
MAQGVRKAGTALPETKDLEVFRAVFTEGGVNAAGRALGLPRSTVSRRLSQLESALRVRLFTRHGQMVTPTEEGARLAERTKDLLSGLEDLCAEARGVDEEPTGRVRLSAPADLSGERDLWVKLFRAFPRLAFELEFTNRYVDVVREGFDLALRGGRGTDDQLVVRKLGGYELWAVASPGYVKQHGRATAPVELRRHTLLLLSPLAARPEAPMPRAPHRHLVVGDPQVARHAALDGLGVAILPRALVLRDLARRALVPFVEAYAPLRVPLFAAFPTRRLMPASLRLVLDHLGHAFSVDGTP